MSDGDRKKGERGAEMYTGELSVAKGDTRDMKRDVERPKPGEREAAER